VHDEVAVAVQHDAETVVLGGDDQPVALRGREREGVVVRAVLGDPVHVRQSARIEQGDRGTVGRRRGEPVRRGDR